MSDTMATTSFTCFPRLPTELRLRIWSLALRPRERATHFFHSCGDSFYSSIDLENEVRLKGPPPWKRVALDADRELEDAGSSPQDNAPESSSTAPSGGGGRCSPATAFGRSAYLWDAGLWDACQESHDVVQQHYSHLRDKLLPLIPEAATARAARTLALSLDMDRDLACILPSKRWETVSTSQASDQATQLGIATMRPPGWNYLGNQFRNLAIVTDDSWTPIHQFTKLSSVRADRSATQRGDLVSTIIDFAAMPKDQRDEHFSEGIYFWVIDPNARLSPRYYADSSRLLSRTVFHGLDCVFAECSRFNCDEGTDERSAAFNLLDFLEYREMELYDLRHFSNTGESIHDCELCHSNEHDFCPASDFDLYNVFGILVPVQLDT